MTSMVRPGSTGSVAILGVTAADAVECASRSFEVQQLAARVARCADEADTVLAALARLELQTWQSPAGRAYRLTLSLQAAALRRSRDALLDAVAVVRRHAQNVTLSSDRVSS
ncbi:hypothetical protein SAMN04487914_101189 [Arthrobacter sp. ok909]|uniref:hypothetical protein n=1 Tax=Arthrobacter sp. ok909 TaxID=1761746 RepID=UPI00088887AC|nr:hypothetical protein [Arthrobacter sp. ok909]SDO93151.1 hypothetical protein SAMN04487914_101189 [Arthrobacter sp. ok909]